MFPTHTNQLPQNSSLGYQLFFLQNNNKIFQVLSHLFAQFWCAIYTAQKGAKKHYFHWYEKNQENEISS